MRLYRQAINPSTYLSPNLTRTYIPDDKSCVPNFIHLAISVFELSRSHEDRLPVDGFCPNMDRNLQIMCEDHIPNVIPLTVFEFPDIIPNLCPSDSGISDISSWNFSTISSCTRK
ncbi:hypothetical protein AVEN_208039-1 [Araneus ventricosus]|uniref:Uncharacterized protein n=1 Tax=Araneus ventricosus TaxID=182803 RepID=A0A4Y2F421_ARAVE|nr:hypothetical protein AVEN_208039-1 [Araneus ventricosus]